MRTRLAELLSRAADRLDGRSRYEITVHGGQIIVSTTDAVTSDSVNKLCAIYDAFVIDFGPALKHQYPRIIGRSEDG